MKNNLIYGVLFSIFFFITALVRAQTDLHVKSGENIRPINFPSGGCVYHWKNNNPEIGLVGEGNGSISSFVAVNNTDNPITATITAEPLHSDFAYIANFGSNDVSVISILSKTVVATIPVGTNPYGVSVSQDGTRAYIANNGSNNVSVINTLTNTVDATIEVGMNPRGLMVSYDGKWLYVANGGSNTVSVINTASNTVVKTIEVDETPYGVAVSPDGSKVFVTNYNSNTLSVITTSTFNVKSVPTGPNPISVAISPDGSMAYVSNYGLYTMTAVRTSDNSVTNTFSIRRNPTGLVVSKDSKRIYYVGAGDGLFGVFDLAYNSGPAFAFSTVPEGMSVTPDYNYVYVTDIYSDEVYYMNLDLTVQDAGTIAVGTTPYSFGNFIARLPGCEGEKVIFTITVDPPPNITIGPVSGGISACLGTVSSAPQLQYFAVSGVGLSEDVGVKAPPGFEISLSSGGIYGGNLVLKQNNGIVNSSTIYVRASEFAPVGHIVGNVLLRSAGVPDQNITVTANVNKLPLVNPVKDQIVLGGNSTSPVNFTGTANSFTWINNNPGIGLKGSGAGDIASFTAVNHTSVPQKATIMVTPLPAPAYAYITNIKENTVSVVNLENDGIVASIPVGVQPTGVAVSPDGKRVYITNQNLIGPPTGNTVSVIEAGSNKVITNIPVNDRPHGVAISPDGSRLYVACQSPSNTINVINTLTNNVVKTMPSGGENPQSLIVSPDGSRLYVTNNSSGKVMVFNTATNSAIGSAQAGGWPLGIAVTPDNKHIYVANYTSNTVSVIDAVSYATLSNIPVDISPTGLVISAGGDRTYVANTISGTVSVIDNNTRKIIATIPVGTFPKGVSLSGDGTKLYVCNAGSDDVTVINTLNNSVLKTVKAGAGPNSFGSFVTQATGCTGNSLSFDITVNPTPDIKFTILPKPVNTSFGTPSVASTFNVSGINLSEGILVTPPTGFEVSTDNITFTNTVTVGGPAINVAEMQVYIRLGAKANAGAYSGSISLTSQGATAINVQMPISMVTPAKITLKADDVKKVYGEQLNDNVTATGFTVAAGGLKNGNTINSVNLTYANGAGPTASVGLYQSIVLAVNEGGNGFLAGNYEITYVAGNIIIIPAPITITAKDVNKLYGKVLASETNSTAFFVTGLKNQEFIATVAISYNKGAAANDPVGVYQDAVSPSSANGGTFSPSNYEITYHSGKIIVAPPVAIISSGSLEAVNTVYGTPSGSTGIVISGTGLPARANSSLTSIWI